MNIPAKVRTLARSEWTRQMVAYVLFAGIATAVDVGILYALTEYAGVYYLVSATISYTFGMVVNYTLNKRFTFRNTSHAVARQFGVFALIASVGLGINLLALYVLVQYFGFYYLIAKLVGLALSFVWSFFGHKFVTFRLLR